MHLSSFGSYNHTNRWIVKKQSQTVVIQLRLNYKLLDKDTKKHTIFKGLKNNRLPPHV